MLPPPARVAFAVALVTAATLWTAAIVATPTWQGPGASGPQATLASLVQLASSRVCHQRPDRSFHTGDRAWPVCARCSGLYVGAAAGTWLAVATSFWPRRQQPRSRAESHRWPLLLSAGPTGLSWALEFAGWVSPSNAARFLLAVPLGLFAAWLLTSMAAGRVE